MSKLNENFEKQKPTFLFDPLINSLTNAIIAADKKAVLIIIEKNLGILKKRDNNGFTPLQIAFSMQDIQIFKTISDALTPLEIKNQLDEITDGNIVAFYHKQREQADEIFKFIEIEALLLKADRKDLSHCINHTINYHSPLKMALNKFSFVLEKYMEDNKIYNKHLFIHAAEIYRRIFNLKKCDERDLMITLLSSQVIGKIQFHSPQAWKILFSQGIFKLWINSRSSVIYSLYFDQDDHPLKHLIDLNTVKELGETCCIDMHGQINNDAKMMHTFSSITSTTAPLRGPGAWSEGSSTSGYTFTRDYASKVKGYFHEHQNEFLAIAFQHKSFVDYARSTMEAGCFVPERISYCSMM